MVKYIVNEFREGDLAVRTVRVTFLGIPVFSLKQTSTNNAAVRQLTVVKSSNNIKGFNK